jgi:hypothetical protein
VTKGRWTFRAAQAAAIRHGWGLRALAHTAARGWEERARCRTLHPQMFLGPESSVARAVCESCPVRLACLSSALRLERGHPRSHLLGVRGGLSADERFAVLQDERRVRVAA